MPFRQRVGLGRIDKTEKFGLGVVNQPGSPKVVERALAAWMSHRWRQGCLLPSWCRAGAFMWDIYFLLFGGQGVSMFFLHWHFPR